MSCLDIQDLSIGMGEGGCVDRVVDHVSIRLESGTITGLVGESGAGKSIIGRAVLGLLQPSFFIAGGRILLDGETVDITDERSMRKLRGKTIGAVFQDPMTCLDPLMTIGGQIIETIRTHRKVSRSEARLRARDWLEKVNLSDPDWVLRSYPHMLSGGMRQRTAIAMSLSAEPAIIIADEPTTALDVSNQTAIVMLLKRLVRDHGLSLLLISHDIGMIANASDRIAVLYAGRLVESGATDAVIGKPRHPYTRSLIGAVPNLFRQHAKLVQIPGVMPSPGSRPSGCVFHPRCPQASAICQDLKPSIRPDGVDHAFACWLTHGDEVAQRGQRAAS